MHPVWFITRSSTSHLTLSPGRFFYYFAWYAGWNGRGYWTSTSSWCSCTGHEIQAPGNINRSFVCKHISFGCSRGGFRIHLLKIFCSLFHLSIVLHNHATIRRTISKPLQTISCYLPHLFGHLGHLMLWYYGTNIVIVFCLYNVLTLWFFYPSLFVANWLLTFWDTYTASWLRQWIVVFTTLMWCWNILVHRIWTSHMNLCYLMSMSKLFEVWMAAGLQIKFLNLSPMLRLIITYPLRGLFLFWIDSTFDTLCNCSISARHSDVWSFGLKGVVFIQM